MNGVTYRFGTDSMAAGGEAERLGGTTTSQDAILGGPLGLFFGPSQRISGSRRLHVAAPCAPGGICAGSQP